ncbi:MAG: autotransporter-associated beta strand repeat-containing protein [Thermoguttaceae bacterium]|jgi:autotransporter-associated beta strand protein
MSYRKFSWAILGVLVLAVLAAPPQAGAQITLTDTGTVWTNNSDNTPISNPLTLSRSANTLVVDLSWRTTVGTTPTNPPVVTYNNVNLTAAATALSPSNPSVGANWTETAVYYLFNPPTGASDALAVTFPTGSLTTYAVNAFSLGGVDTTLPPDQLAGWTTSSLWEGSGTTAPAATNTISATVNDLLAGSDVVSSGVYRATNGQPTSFVTTAAGAYGSLNTSGAGGGSGNFWQQATSDCLDYGALVQNVTSPSLTFTTSANLLSARMNVAVASFAAAGAPGVWTGATNANWSLSGTDTNWSGGAAYTDGTAVRFTDAGSAHPNVTIVGTVQPASVWFGNLTVPYAFSGGAISGSASVTLAGTGSVTFNSANAYSGGTNVLSGALTANVNNALGTGPVNVNGGSLTANTDLALGSGPLNVASGGTVNFPSAKPSINGLADGSPGSGGSVVLGNAATSTPTNLTVASNAPSTFSGVISDLSVSNPAATGTLTKAGPSTLTLAGFNTYTGGTNITAGNLVANGVGSGPIYLDGGTFSPWVGQPGNGLTANYYGPSIPNFSHLSPAQNSLSNFNTVYLPPAGPPSYTDNITADVVNGAKGNFDFDTAGEGLNFPSPFNQAASQNWAASYTGYFYAAKAGTYTFGLNSDDNSRLWIDGNTNDMALVIDGTSSGGQANAGYGVVQASGTVNLTAGFHQITVGYDEGGGSWGLEAFVALPGATLANNHFLPVSLLYTAPASVYSNPLLVDSNSTLGLNAGIAYSFPSLTIGASGASTLHVTGSGAGLTINGPTTLAGPATLNVDPGLNVTLEAVSGSGGLTKAGGGMLVLTTTGTYTGGTTVNGGKLILGPAAGLADGPITVNVGGVFAPQPADGGSIVAGTGNASLNVASGGTFDMSGDSAAGIFQVNGNAAGRSLTLGGGTLGFDVGSGSSSTPADELLINGGSAAVSGMNIISITALPSFAPGKYTLIADSAGGLTGTFALSNSGVVIGNQRYPLTLVNSSTAESVTVGAPSQLYTFNWSALAAGNGLWTNPANWDDNEVPGAGDVPVFSGTGATKTAVDLGTGNVTVAGLVFNKNLNNINISATTNSAAQLILDNGSQPATVTVGGTHTISAGVQLNSSVQITTTTSADQLTISGAINDNGTGQSLTKAGAGKLLLTGALTYSGPTYLTAGTLAINAPVPGMIEGLVSITNGNPEDITSPIPLGSFQRVARWGASTNYGTNAAGPPDMDPSSSNPLAWTNNTTIGYSGFIDNKSNTPITYTFGKNFDDCAYLSIDDNVVINDNTWTTVQTYSITLSPGIHSMDLRFGQGGGGVGPNTGAGITGNNGGAPYDAFGVAYNTVGNTAPTGTWNQMGASDSNTAFFASFTGAPNTSVVMSSNTTLDVSGTSAFGTMVVLGSLADASGSPTGQQVLLGANTLETGFDNTDATFSGAISGSGGLIKTGSGNFTLAGASTFTGPTAVNNGTLWLTGPATLATSPAISIASGATLDAIALAAGLTRTANQSLGGGGTLSGNLTATGATITPDVGNSLTVSGSAVLNSGTVLNLGIGDGTQQLLSVGGNLTASGTVTINAPLLGNSVTPGDSTRLSSTAARLPAPVR